MFTAYLDDAESACLKGAFQDLVDLWWHLASAGTRRWQGPAATAEEEIRVQLMARTVELQTATHLLSELVARREELLALARSTGL